MRRGWPLLLPVLVLVTAPPLRGADPKPAAAADSDKAPDFAKQIAPLLSKYCTECHSGDKPKGKLALDKYKDEQSALKNGKLWDKVAQRLTACTMPPKSKPQPSPEEKTVVLDWVEKTVNQAGCIAEKDPGRVTMRRLNRGEYNNTIRDLLGVESDFSANFPSDDVGYGFDNIGDVLSMPPILMEKYLSAADKIVAKTLETPEAKDTSRVADALNQLKRKSSIRLRRAESVRTESRPAIEGREIVLRDALTIPGLSAALDYFENVDLPRLVDLAAHHTQVADLFEAYNRARRPVALPNFLAALAMLVASEVLVDA